MTDDE
jgi:hypothetical protein